MSLRNKPDQQPPPAATSAAAARANGVQTLLRGLELLEAIAAGCHDLQGLCTQTALSRSTAHRLLSALSQQGYVRHLQRRGYYLGPRLIGLGFKAHAQLHLPSLARPHLEWLREQTQETVNLAVLEGNHVVYIDKVPGKRELQLASYIGAQLPVQSTALGKSLLCGLPPGEWPRYFVPGLQRTPQTIADLASFERAIAEVARQGYALDLEENEPGIRCIGAPVRDGSGAVVAAISLTSATIYTDEERLQQLIPLVKTAAQGISRELGGHNA